MKLTGLASVTMMGLFLLRLLFVSAFPLLFSCSSLLLEVSAPIWLQVCASSCSGDLPVFSWKSERKIYVKRFYAVNGREGIFSKRKGKM